MRSAQHTIEHHCIISSGSGIQTDSSEVGGKGWNLLRLRKFGFNVPPFFVVKSEVFETVVAPFNQAISDMLDSIDYTNQNRIEDVSKKIKELILEASVPTDNVHELLSEVDSLGGSDVLYSVRSSVTDEDSTQHSFAGQMDSFLNVHSNNVLNFIRQVWASAYSARSLAYRNKIGQSVHNICVAVIVQEMLQSTKSGVTFSRNPETMNQECVIVAGYGLGEGVVTNQVETDTYRSDWYSNQIEKEIAIKTTCLCFQNDETTCNSIKSVPAVLRSTPVLTDEQILQLRDIALKAESDFTLPIDMEWAYDDTGHLYILQARPITGAHQRSHEGPIRVWDNSNIVESYPGVTLPLTFSFIREAYEVTFRRVILGFHLRKNILKQKADIFKSMIGLMEGHVYYNLLNWYMMLSFLPGFQQHKKSWDQMIGITHKIDFPESRLSLMDRVASMLISVWRLLTPRKNAHHFFKYFDSVYARYQKDDISNANEYELLVWYESLSKKISQKWHLTLFNDFAAMKYYAWLKTLCNRWELQNSANLHNNLLCGVEGIESVAPVRELVRIAELFRSDPTFSNLLSIEDDGIVWRKIQDESEFMKLKETFAAYLARFGDRGFEELKLETATYRDNPDRLIALIRKYVLLELTYEDITQKEQNIKREAEHNVKKTLKNPFKYLVFTFILRKARISIANRENMRFARSRLYGIIRRLFRQMGDIFRKKGLIDSNYDIFYLSIDEIFSKIRGTAVTQDLRSLITVRKNEYKKFEESSLEERFETNGIPCFNIPRPAHEKHTEEKHLQGIGCSSGIVNGIGKIILNPSAENDCSGRILIARSTDPGWVFLMISSSGIIVEKGSVLSHTAIIGRELGIPTIVGVKGATKCIPDGVRIDMNGSTGEIQWE